MDVRTILVEPRNEENIGAVARVLKNFGLTDLYLVNPPTLRAKAFSVASHAADLLSACTIVSTLDEAIANAALVVGTTSQSGVSTDRHLRRPFFTPRELKAKVKEKRGLLALLFGREDTGLVNEELMRCDLVLRIPTSPGYPVMNLSHAVAVVLYELSELETVLGTTPLAGVEEKERLYEHFRAFLDEIEYRPHKKAKTLLMLRRILGRAELTAVEVRTLHGILSKAEWKLERREDEPCDEAWLERR
jgi:tRNA/rRNA methyltransferase